MKAKSKQHVCPWWLGFILVNPIRKYWHDPVKILSPYVFPGMKIVDYGSAMGYFSLPMAKITGKTGKVYCMDIQQKMLDKLMTRAKKANLQDVVQPVLINEKAGYEKFYNQMDFALLFAVVHEVPDKEKLFNLLFKMLKPGSSVLFAEPKGHVKIDEFERSINTALNEGFEKRESLQISGSHTIILRKR